MIVIPLLRSQHLFSPAAMPPLLFRRWFKASITPLPARKGSSGVPEVPSGYPKSPPSQSMTESNSTISSRFHRPGSPNAVGSCSKNGASRTIAEQCERLLCGTMKQIFLGGEMMDLQYDSCTMGSIGSSNSSGSDSDRESEDKNSCAKEKVIGFLEVWDYVGGTSFRGFIVDKSLPYGGFEKTLFLFFEHVKGSQLKHGLMALIELASECFACNRLVMCLERNAEGLRGLVRDLGWVGFELITLANWVHTQAAGMSFRSASLSSTSSLPPGFLDHDITSEKWLFLGMEV